MMFSSRFSFLTRKRNRFFFTFLSFSLSPLPPNPLYWNGSSKPVFRVTDIATSGRKNFSPRISGPNLFPSSKVFTALLSNVTPAKFTDDYDDICRELQVIKNFWDANVNLLNWVSESWHFYIERLTHHPYFRTVKYFVATTRKICLLIYGGGLSILKVTSDFDVIRQQSIYIAFYL